MEQTSEKPSVRFLSFCNDKEDAEKDAKLREAAATIEQAIAKQKSLSELIDVKISNVDEAIDLNNDTRPLYERLLEQKNRKQEALEESQKLSNLVTKLDEDDVNYLNEVAKAKQEEELRKRLEVYDALEEKRRSNETKILEEERLMKQSLSGAKMSSKSSPLKTKLSSLIKIKPKIIPKESPSRDISEKPARVEVGDLNSDSADEPSDGTRQTRSSSKRYAPSNDRDCCERTSKNPEAKPNAGNDEVAKRQKIDGHDEDSSDDKEKSSQPNDSSTICCCPDNIMKCIGVLPSLPIVNKIRESDSDNSDDDLNRRIVPTIGCRK